MTVIDYEALLAEQHAAWLADTDAELEAAMKPIKSTGWDVLDLSLRELRKTRIAIVTEHRHSLLALHEKQRTKLQAALHSGFLE